MKKFFGLVVVVLFAASFARAQQKAEVAISLNEQFFDALLDAVFTNLKPPSFPLAAAAASPKSDESIQRSAVSRKF